MKPKTNIVVCSICNQEFLMGRTGTTDGCDSCLGVVRDKDGYIYEPDEAFIVLQDIETGREEIRQRPKR